MKLVLYKGLSCGPSSIGTPIFFGDTFLKARQLVVQLDKFLAGFDFTVIIGQITLIEFDKDPIVRFDISANKQAVNQRLADIIELTAPIFLLGVRKEKDRVKIDRLGGYIHEVPFWTFPNHMELGLDHYSRPLPNTPARVCFSAVSDNMLWHNTETFIDWISRQRLEWDEGRILIRNAEAKGTNM